jgi:hypothetical protein
MATSDIVHRFVAELKQEAEDISKGIESEMISADASPSEVLEAVAIILDSILEAVPAPETLGDATIILDCTEPFGEGGRNMLISGEDNEDPDNPGSVLPTPDATDEEKLIAYDSVPMTAVLKLAKLMDVPASLATDAERQYVRNHRLVKGGIDYDSIDSLLEYIQSQVEKDALADLATGVEWDIPEELRAAWSAEDGEQNGS